MQKAYERVTPLGQLLAESAPGFTGVTKTTSSNPSEADIDEQGE